VVAVLLRPWLRLEATAEMAGTLGRSHLVVRRVLGGGRGKRLGGDSGLEGLLVP